MVPPPWAYQVENFVTKPDEELICSVCHSIFCNPVMSPCDHVFCKGCITKWLQNHRSCPICRKRVPKYSIKQIVPIVKNLILKLTLYCKNKDQGCEAQISLECCESHLKECSFEMLQCKNKPCREKLFRKDLENHETNECTHRFIKCPSCGSKMSLQSKEKAHNCITALQLRIKKKSALLRKKNERLRELKAEMQKLKEVSPSVNQSSVSSSSFSSDRIRINISESLTSDSEASSDSYIAIIANSESYSTDGNHSDSFEGFLESYDDNVDPISAIYNVDDEVEDEGNLENSGIQVNNSEQEPNSEPEERSLPRRPPKRRLPYLFSSSEDDNDMEDHQTWSSPKRPWLSFQADHNTSTEAGARNSGDSATEPGTSANNNAGNCASSDNSNSNAQQHSNAERSARSTRQRNPKRKSNMKSKSRSVFENTLALLEQYNLESDPEWLPEYASHRGDTPSPSESESSYDDLDVLDGSSSSSSDIDSTFSSRI